MLGAPTFLLSKLRKLSSVSVGALNEVNVTQTLGRVLRHSRVYVDSFQLHCRFVEQLSHGESRNDCKAEKLTSFLVLCENCRDIYVRGICLPD